MPCTCMGSAPNLFVYFYACMWLCIIFIRSTGGGVKQWIFSPSLLFKANLTTSWYSEIERRNGIYCKASLVSHCLCLYFCWNWRYVYFGEQLSSFAIVWWFIDFQVSLDVSKVLSDLLEAVTSMKDALSFATITDGELSVMIRLTEEKQLSFAAN